MKTLFKLNFILAFLAFTAFSVTAQEKRASPAMEAEGKVEATSIKVTYGSPSVKDRTIWGGLVPYDKLWRAGANEATTFETSDDIMIGGEKLPKGKYALFIIPNEKEWTFVFNSDPDQWGAYKYDEKKDVLRVNAKPMMSKDMTESLTYKVGDDGLTFMWDKVNVNLPIKK